jgi:hypothetical protein
VVEAARMGRAADPMVWLVSGEVSACLSGERGFGRGEGGRCMRVCESPKKMYNEAEMRK